jgi:hypothetical protein
MERPVRTARAVQCQLLLDLANAQDFRKALGTQHA